MQTKKHSFYEAISNTGVGFIISLAATFIVFPIAGVDTSPGQNLAVTVLFTVISVIRNYVVRRWFNDLDETVIVEPSTMYCFDCDIDMPVELKGKDLYCANCGLKHTGGLKYTHDHE